MSIFNKRNAVLGWGVWQVAKGVAKRKAKEATPGTGDKHTRLKKSAVAGAAAAALAALLFWRKKSEETPASGS